MSNLKLIAKRVSEQDEESQELSFEERVLSLESKLEEMSSTLDAIKAALQEMKVEEVEPESDPVLESLLELRRAVDEKPAPVMSDYTEEIDGLRASIQSIEKIMMNLAMREQRDYSLILADIAARIEVLEKRPTEVRKVIDLTGMEFDIVRRPDNLASSIRIRK